MVATEVHDILKIIINNHTVQCEPFTIKIFTPEQGKSILKFFRNTFLKYYSLWEIALTKFIDYNIFSQEKFSIQLPKLSSLKTAKEIDASEVLELQYLFIKSNELVESEFQQNENDDINQSEENQIEQSQEKQLQQSEEKKMRERTGSEVLVESQLQSTIAQFQASMAQKLKETEAILNEEVQTFLAAKDPKKKK